MALAGSGLSQTNEVTALHNWWDGLKLDWCRCNITEHPYTGHDGRMKTEDFEIH